MNAFTLDVGSLFTHFEQELPTIVRHVAKQHLGHRGDTFTAAFNKHVLADRQRR